MATRHIAKLCQGMRGCCLSSTTTPFRSTTLPAFFVSPTGEHNLCCARGFAAQASKTPKIADSGQYVKRVQVLGREKEWREVLRLYERVRDSKNLRMTVKVYGATITALARNGCKEQAFTLLEEAKSAGVKPDIVLYTAVAESCKDQGAWKDALGILAAAKEDKLKPDALLYGTIANLCAQEREWEHALSLLKEMREEQNFGQVGEDYDAAVEACMNGGPIDNVRIWLKLALREARAPKQDAMVARQRRMAPAPRPKRPAHRNKV